MSSGCAVSRGLASSMRTSVASRRLLWRPGIRAEGTASLPMCTAGIWSECSSAGRPFCEGDLVMGVVASDFWPWNVSGPSSGSQSREAAVGGPATKAGIATGALSEDLGSSPNPSICARRSSSSCAGSAPRPSGVLLWRRLTPSGVDVRPVCTEMEWLSSDLRCGMVLPAAWYLDSGSSAWASRRCRGLEDPAPTTAAS